MTAHAPYRHHRINCLKVADHVEQELDHRLSSAAYREFRAHLQRCPNCSAYLDSLKKTIYLYQCVPSPHVSKKCRDKLFAVLKLNVKTH